MAPGKIDLLATPEAPGADHQEADKADQHHPDAGHPCVKGVAFKAVDDSGNDSSRCGDGHADKILAARAAGILGRGIVADVEARETAGSTEEKEKADKATEPDEVLAEHRIDGRRQHAESPAEGEDAWRHSKGDDVGQRIELLAEVAGGVGHSRNAPIQGIEGDGKAYRQRGVIKMMGF